MNKRRDVEAGADGHGSTGELEQPRADEAVDRYRGSGRQTSKPEWTSLRSLQEDWREEGREKGGGEGRDERREEREER